MQESYLVCSNCFEYIPFFDYHVGDDIPKCTSCQHELLPVQPLEGDEMLLARLHQQPQPLLLDFWGAWSGPCREFSPLFNDYADRFKGKVIFVKINSEEEQVLANQLRVCAFPTLILFQNGREKQRLTGFINESHLDTLLKAYD
ncbi:thioredoxin domain-containing protein [Psychromonas sp.]|nr:thioredoxin domain-containing protein [Psychromonas sp.]